MQKSSDDLYGAIIDGVLEVQKHLKASKADPPKTLGEVADKLFALRECVKRLEELRREISRVEEQYEKIFIAVYLASSSSMDKIKTEYVTAEAVPCLGLRVPRVNEECYVPLMTFLGIPKEVQAHGVLTIHFPGWCNYYTALQARGEDVPDEVKTSLTEYEMCKVKTIKRKSLRGSINVQGIDETI